eukprot:gene37717-50917_t
MIVRKSSWSAAFFRQWWAMHSTPLARCDQHINSLWPSISNYSPTDRILHLMGETTRTRADIFAYTSSLLYSIYN